MRKILIEQIAECQRSLGRLEGMIDNTRRFRRAKARQVSLFLAQMGLLLARAEELDFIEAEMPEGAEEMMKAREARAAEERNG